MFFWLVVFVMILGTVAYIQSYRADQKARENKMKILRQKIEANDKKKLFKKLNQNNKNTKPD